MCLSCMLDPSMLDPAYSSIELYLVFGAASSDPQQPTKPISRTSGASAGPARQLPTMNTMLVKDGGSVHDSSKKASDWQENDITVAWQKPNISTGKIQAVK